MINWKAERRPYHFGDIVEVQQYNSQSGKYEYKTGIFTGKSANGNTGFVVFPDSSITWDFPMHNLSRVRAGNFYSEEASVK